MEKYKIVKGCFGCPFRKLINVSVYFWQKLNTTHKCILTGKNISPQYWHDYVPDECPLKKNNYIIKLNKKLKQS